MARNRPGLKRYQQTAQHWTNSRSNMSHLRYLKSQPHLQQETVARGAGKFGGNIQVPARAGVGGSGLTGIQRALSAIGLGGAAHPIRRLEHPGGQMMFPYLGAGPGAASIAAEAAPVGARAAATRVEEASAGAGFRQPPQSEIADMVQGWNKRQSGYFARMDRARMEAEPGRVRRYLNEHPRTEEAAASAAAVGLVGGGYAGGFALTGHPLWRRREWSGPAFPSSDPGGALGPSKRQTQNQAAIDQRVHDAFKSDVGWLVGSKQLKPANARETLQWAANMATARGGATYIRDARNYVKDNYRPPPSGWTKTP